MRNGYVLTIKHMYIHTHNDTNTWLEKYTVHRNLFITIIMIIHTS